MPEARIRDEGAGGEGGDGGPEEVESGEGVPFAGQEERRAPDGRPVLGPQPRLGTAGPVEGIREADKPDDGQPTVGGDEARHPAPEGVAADDEGAVHR
ncbi:MAG: hypothetical protein KatS3mg065_0310 [Chloroflexota bacterium]|nr:MAG: hypothetical protein KatS3mg065_0310 [Chloroflexota bacterium]